MSVNLNGRTRLSFKIVAKYQSWRGICIHAFGKSDILLKHHCFVILATLFYKWVRVPVQEFGAAIPYGPI
jgi:hypothetical protein